MSLNPEERRRSSDTYSDAIIKKLDKTTDDIALMQGQLNRLAVDLYEQTGIQNNRYDSLNSSIAPLASLLDDVAAVGRAGKFVKSVVIWTVVVGGALGAFYEYLGHLIKLK